MGIILNTKRSIGAYSVEYTYSNQSTMATASLLFVASAALALIVFIARKALRAGSRPKGLPPGPPTELIWGNTRQVTTSQGDHPRSVRPGRNGRARGISRLVAIPLETSGVDVSSV